LLLAALGGWLLQEQADVIKFFFVRKIGCSDIAVLRKNSVRLRNALDWRLTSRSAVAPWLSVDRSAAQNCVETV
jgi:hypothetical protein